MDELGGGERGVRASPRSTAAVLMYLDDVSVAGEGGSLSLWPKDNATACCYDITKGKHEDL